MCRKHGEVWAETGMGDHRKLVREQESLRCESVPSSDNNVAMYDESRLHLWFVECAVTGLQFLSDIGALSYSGGWISPLSR